MLIRPTAVGICGTDVHIIEGRFTLAQPPLVLGHEWSGVVEAVGDGEAALAAAKTRRPDLVLSDVMMPRLDGFGLLRQLRSDPGLAEIPVVLLSARAGEEAQVEGLGERANEERLAEAGRSLEQHVTARGEAPHHLVDDV